MSVEFSGQRMKSGWGTWPSLAFTIRLMVSERWLLVTERARPRASIPRPGTLPCTMPTVTDGCSPAGGAVAGWAAPQTAPDQHQRGADGDRRHGTSSPGRTASTGRESQHQVRDQLADQRDQERDAGHADRGRSTPPAVCPPRRTRAGSSRTRRTGSGRTRTRSTTQQHAAATGQSRNRRHQRESQTEQPKNNASKAIRATATQIPSTWIQLIETPSIARPNR